MKSIFILSVICVFFLCNALVSGGQMKSKQQHKLQKIRKNDRNGCKMNLLTDIPDNEPVYLHQKRKSFALYKPSGQLNIISKNLILLCPGKKNKLTNQNTNTTMLTCQNQNQNQNNQNNKSQKNNNQSKEYDLKEYNCTGEVIGNIKATKTKCGPTNNPGQIILIGFKMNPKQFIEVYKVCYNNLTASTLWSKHSINGKAIKYNIKENQRHEFKNNGIRNDVRPTSSYKRAEQITHFGKILGTAHPYFNQSSFLAKGHLTPDADFVFTSGQFSTYFYINTCPQFQSINNGNWRRVENLARSLAELYNTELTIYTGVYEQLTLPDQHHKNTVLALDENGKIPVPKWLWKIIGNEQAGSAIVMLTLNNPFAKKSDVQNVCENVCDKAGINSRHFQTIRKGYTICCELNAFRQVVKGILPQSSLFTTERQPSGTPQSSSSSSSNSSYKLLNCANAVYDKI